MPASITGTATPDAGLQPKPPPQSAPTGDISEAIARGFSTVLKDMRAMQREMLVMAESIQKSATLTATRMDAAASVSAKMSGLRPPSGHSRGEAVRRAFDARAVAAGASEEADAVRGVVRAAVVPPGVQPTPIMREQVVNPPRDPNAFQDAYDNSVKNMREGVANRVARRAQNWAGRDGLMQDPRDPNIWYHKDPNLRWDDSAGRWRGKDGRFIDQSVMDEKRVVKTPGYRQLANGRWINEATKKFASAKEVQKAATGWETVAKFQSKARVAGAVSDAANAFAEGKPIGRALLSALPAETAATLGTVAGGAAAAYALVRSAASKSQELYREGVSVSQYTGGSAWEGFKESWRDKIGAWAQGFNFFGPGAAEYSLAASTATRLGMRGRNKEKFISQGLDIMDATSMTGEETVRIMASVVQAGQSLDGLGESLRSVTKAARTAGMATDEARKKFEQNFVKMAQGLYGQTGTAQAFATQLTNIQTAQGQGSGFANVATNQSYGNVGMLAAYSGKTIQQYLNDISTNPSVLEVDRDRLLIEQFSLIGFTKTLTSGFLQWYKSNRGGQFPLGGATGGQKNVLSQWMTDGSTHIAINPYDLLAIMESVGVTNIPSQGDANGINTGEVFYFALQIVEGKGIGATGANATNSKSASMERTTVGNGKTTYGDIERNGRINANYRPNIEDLSLSRFSGRLSAAGAYQGGGRAGGAVLTDFARKILSKYSDALGVTGKGGELFQNVTSATEINPVVESLIVDLIGKKIARDVKINIPGVDKPVTVEEAIGKYYSDIQGGSATFASGDFSGESIASHYGLTAEGMKQQVEIGLTPEAKKYLQIEPPSTSTVPTTSPFDPRNRWQKP